MAETTQVTVTREWAKLSDGDCTVQSAYIDDFYHVHVGSSAPTSDASIKINLDEAATFAYKTAVYCKLAANSKRESSIVNVIK